MLQLSPIGLNSNADLGQVVTKSQETFLANFWVITVLYVLGILAVLWALFYLLRRILRAQSFFPATFQKIVLSVRVPKESEEAKEKERSPTQRPIMEVLNRIETLFSNLGGLKPLSRFKAFLYGYHEHLAFEVVAHQGLISFFVAAPRRLRNFIEQQIQAQYPNAQIEEVEDYNIFKPQGVIIGTYLTLTKKSIFPIKTYRKSEADSQEAILNTLSKLGEEDGVAIQLLLRPARKSWQSWGAKVAREMQQGKKLSEAMGGSGAGVFKSVKSQIFAKSKKDEDPYKRESEIHRLTPMEEELVKAIEEKGSKIGFETNLKLIVSSNTLEMAKVHLANLVSSFTQFTAPESNNAFKKSGFRFFKSRLIKNFIYRRFSNRQKIILNSEELVSLYHFPLPTSEVPNIHWLEARQASAPPNLPKEGLILGENVYRGTRTVIRIKRDDRRRHVYVIGKTGTGKSVFIQNLAVQDIRNGEGVCVIDPHGDLIEAILPCISKERADDVVIFEPSDTSRPVGLNMLECKAEEQKDFAIQEMIAIFYKLFPPEMIGPMFEHNMRNVMLTLMEDKESPGTIAEIPRMFTDPEFQKYKLTKVKNPVVRAFWEKEMAKTSDFHKSEMLGYLISKVGRFVENDMMRNIIGQPVSGFDFREIMDKQKILLVNLSKGKTGEVNSSLLGLIIVSKLQMAAMTRAELPAEERKDFYLYVDEFQNFITDSIATILSEARKYRLNLIIAHQYVSQLVQGQDTKIRDAVLGTVGTMVAFKIGAEDSEVIAKEFAPVVNSYDLINIDKFNAYIKLLINNQAARPFNILTFPPLKGDPSIAKSIKEMSRLKYGRERSVVEAEILGRSKLGEPVRTQGPPVGERSL